MLGEKLSATMPPEPPENSVVLGEKSGLVHQRIGDEWMSPGAAPFSGRSWFAVLDREGSVVVVHRPDAELWPSEEARAVIRKDAEKRTTYDTWRQARAELAGALGLPEKDTTWPDLLEIVRNDQEILKGAGR
jgi:hypothetical protein